MEKTLDSYVNDLEVAMVNIMQHLRLNPEADEFHVGFCRLQWTVKLKADGRITITSASSPQAAMTEATNTLHIEVS